jgi:hypothetical protein
MIDGCRDLVAWIDFTNSGVICAFPGAKMFLSL